jgi:hypothetical protein
MRFSPVFFSLFAIIDSACALSISSNGAFAILARLELCQPGRVGQPGRAGACTWKGMPCR